VDRAGMACLPLACPAACRVLRSGSAWLWRGGLCGRGDRVWAGQAARAGGGPQPAWNRLSHSA
jgi:hypothetical protein